MNHVLDTRLCVMFSRFCRDRSSCMYLIDGSFYLNAEALSDWKDGGENLFHGIYLYFFSLDSHRFEPFICVQVFCVSFPT